MSTAPTLRSRIRALLSEGDAFTSTAMAAGLKITQKSAAQNCYLLTLDGRLKKEETAAGVQYRLGDWPEEADAPSAPAKRRKSTKKRRDGVTAAQAARINRGGKKAPKKKQPGTALVVRAPITFTQRAPHVEQTLADMRARRQQLDTAIAALETL